ncbi:double-CXXCG motif protein [Myxococcus sp. K15C18031901]|uniref:SitI6 family double-CXXCG motif immunity protein n=1 Tax=Myxococcus dinghuensis TaxID=2906761 RepID=UPI0020A709A8|nr:double-CXXCG motif protein [Myxococcus dinghuensis]MCP3097282.1 double-CXXCG motif protein [Myxococcus dinghuensis]
MRYYELGPTSDAGATKWRWGITGKRPWGLPGTECPRCEAGGATIALNYPSVDLSGLLEEREYRRARLAPWDEYVRLRDRVLSLMPPGAVVRPGTEMGALVGRVRGLPPPVAMDAPWNLYAQPEGVKRLLAAGLCGIKPVPTALKVGRDVPPLLELELGVGGDYAPECRPELVGEPCPVCGTQRRGLEPYRWWLDRDALPEADVFRFRHNPACTIASERFVEVLRNMGDTGIQVTEIAPPAAREANASR